MIVSFSGIDSAGKTTQIDKLIAYLDANNVNYIKKWSKARGTPGIEFVKSLIRRDVGLDERAKAEVRKNIYQNKMKQKLLYIASLFDLCWYWGVYYRVLNITHKYLICDRYLWDTYVELKHDFYNIDIDNSMLWKLVKSLAPVPDVSFVFLVPAELSLQRDIMKDASDIEEINIKKSKIDLYHILVDSNMWTNVMDGTLSREMLHSMILEIMNI